MRIEGKIERAEQLVRRVEEAERDVSRAEARLVAAQQRAAAARSRPPSGADKKAEEKSRNERRAADAAVGAAEAALESARRQLGTARAARDELAGGMRGYVAEQRQAVAQIRRAMAAAPYGRDQLVRARETSQRHARIGNRVLSILGADTIALDEGADPRAPEPLGRGDAAGAGFGAVGPSPAGGGSSAGAVPRHRARRAADGALTGAALDKLAQDFRRDLRLHLGWETPDDLLFSPGEPPVGLREMELAQDVIDRYGQSLARTPGADAALARLRAVCDEELAPRSVDGPLRLAVNRTGAPPQQSEQLNPHPAADVEAARIITANRFGEGSPEAREAAWRYADSIEARQGALEERRAHARQLADEARERYFSFCDAHDLAALTTEGRREHDRLRVRYDAAEAADREAASGLARLERRRAEVTAGLDPSSRTTVAGLGGSTDFEAAYAPFITHPQGYEYDDVAGCCGIGTVGGMTNEQTGARRGWAYYEDAFLSRGAAVYNPGVAFRSSNGGTSPESRCAMLRAFGLEADSVTFGSLSRPDSVPTLDDILELRRQGYSVGIAVRAEDLDGPDVAPRLTSRDGAGWQRSWRRNHSMAVVGVSVDATGEATGLWVNDTGGWSQGSGLRSNRVFISRERYEHMVQGTENLSLEWARVPRDMPDDAGLPRIVRMQRGRRRR